MQNQQLFQSPSHQNAQRPLQVPVAGSSTTTPAAVRSPVHVVHHSLAPFSNNNSAMVRSNLSSVGPSNYHVGGGEVRSHAPHLQPFRPLNSLSAAPNFPLPNVNATMPSHQTLSNPAASGSVDPQHMGHLVSFGSGLLSSTYQSERGGAARTSSGVFEMVMRDFDNSAHGGNGGNSQNLLLSIPSYDPSDLFEAQTTSSLSGTPAAAAARACLPGEVVCLSDDD